MSNLNKVLGIFLVLLFFSASCFAAVWTADGDGISWDDPGNWVGAVVPTLNEFANINAGGAATFPVIDDAQTSGHLTLGHGSGNVSVTIEQSGSLVLGVGNQTTSLGKVIPATLGVDNLTAYLDVYGTMITEGSLYIGGPGAIPADPNEGTEMNAGKGYLRVLGGDATFKSLNLAAWWNGSSYVYTGGGGDVIIDDGGSLTLTNAFPISMHADSEKRLAGINISSETGSKLVLPNYSGASAENYVANMISGGLFVADNGWGQARWYYDGSGDLTVDADPAYVPYDPSVGYEYWNNKLGDNSIASRFNYLNRRMPSPIDGLITNATADWDNRIVVDEPVTLFHAVIGWPDSPGSTFVDGYDYIQIVDGGELNITAMQLGRGQYEEGRGALIVDGGSVTCETLTMFTAEDLVGEIPGARGRLNINAGIVDANDIVGAYESMGINIDAGTLMIYGDKTQTGCGSPSDPNCLFESLRSIGKITAYAGEGSLMVDYDVRNSGKTTITACSPNGVANPQIGDLTGDCRTDLADLAFLARYWLSTEGVAIY